MNDQQKIQEDAKKKLTPEQYNVYFLKGTELPFSGKYTDLSPKSSFARRPLAKLDFLHN